MLRRFWQSNAIKQQERNHLNLLMFRWIRTTLTALQSFIITKFHNYKAQLTAYHIWLQPHWQMFTLLHSGLVSSDDDNSVKSLSRNPAAEPVANKTYHTTKCLHLRAQKPSGPDSAGGRPGAQAPSLILGTTTCETVKAFIASNKMHYWVLIA